MSLRNEETINLHIYVHLDPVVIVQGTPRPGQAVTAILTIGGKLMSPVDISIDTTTDSVKLNWIDDKGDTDAAAPAGAQVSYSSDNPAVATVDPQSGQITPVAEGTANAAAQITGPDGGPLLEPDGVTPFSAPPVPFQVVAGQAVGAGLEIKPAQ